jgi:hypothetical protein
MEVALEGREEDDAKAALALGRGATGGFEEQQRVDLRRVEQRERER